MKSLFLFLALAGFLVGNAFGATFKVERFANIFSSVDKITSVTGSVVASVKAGEVLEVVDVYSAYVKVEAKAGSGWVWFEYFVVNADGTMTPDQNKQGKLGVAIVSEPNTDKVIGAVFGNETVKVTDRWNTWVTVKKNGVTGVIFIGEGTLVK